MDKGYVYIILNTENNKKYVGQTTKPKKRRYKHFSDLQGNRHINDHLQNSYNKYGANKFIFKIIDENIKVEILDEIERWWIKHYNTYEGEGYNLTLGGEKTLRGKDHYNYGKSLSEEEKEHLSKLWSGKNNPMYGISLKGEEHGMYGKTHSKESRKKISENHVDVSGLNNPRCKIKPEYVYVIIKQYFENGKRTYEIADKYNVCRNTISHILNLRHWTFSDLEKRQ